MKSNFKSKGLFMINEEDFPLSKEGSLFIGWMEMRLKECIKSEDYEEASKLKRDIESARKFTKIFKKD